VQVIIYKPIKIKIKMEMGESLKEKGNKEFKKGNYQAAIALYTEALCEEQSETFYGNRAA
jgi:hypothetical protein